MSTILNHNVDVDLTFPSLHLIDLSFPLPITINSDDDGPSADHTTTKLEHLTSGQLACLQFHPLAKDSHELLASAKQLFMKRWEDGNQRKEGDLELGNERNWSGHEKSNKNGIGLGIIQEVQHEHDRETTPTPMSVELLPSPPLERNKGGPSSYQSSSRPQGPNKGDDEDYFNLKTPQKEKALDKPSSYHRPQQDRHHQLPQTEPPKNRQRPASSLQFTALNSRDRDQSQTKRSFLRSESENSLPNHHRDSERGHGAFTPSSNLRLRTRAHEALCTPSRLRSVRPGPGQRPRSSLPEPESPHRVLSESPPASPSPPRVRGVSGLARDQAHRGDEGRNGGGGARSNSRQERGQGHGSSASYPSDVFSSPSSSRSMKNHLTPRLSGGGEGARRRDENAFGGEERRDGDRNKNRNRDRDRDRDRGEGSRTPHDELDMDLPKGRTRNTPRNDWLKDLKQLGQYSSPSRLEKHPGRVNSRLGGGGGSTLDLDEDVDMDMDYDSNVREGHGRGGSWGRNSGRHGRLESLKGEKEEESLLSFGEFGELKSSASPSSRSGGSRMGRERRGSNREEIHRVHDDDPFHTANNLETETERSLLSQETRKRPSLPAPPTFTTPSTFSSSASSSFSHSHSGSGSGSSSSLERRHREVARILQRSEDLGLGRDDDGGNGRATTPTNPKRTDSSLDMSGGGFRGGRRNTNSRNENEINNNLSSSTSMVATPSSRKRNSTAVSEHTVSNITTPSSSSSSTASSKRLRFEDGSFPGWKSKPSSPTSNSKTRDISSANSRMRRKRQRDEEEELMEHDDDGDRTRQGRSDGIGQETDLMAIRLPLRERGRNVDTPIPQSLLHNRHGDNTDNNTNDGLNKSSSLSRRPLGCLKLDSLDIILAKEGIEQPRRKRRLVSGSSGTTIRAGER